MTRFVIALVLCTVGGRAHAQPIDKDRLREAQALAEAAFAAYDRHDYDGAIDLFRRAHDLAPEPGLLFNIAQAHRQKGPASCRDAAEWYAKYLEAATDKKSARVAAARTGQAEMERCAAEQEEEEARRREAAARPAPTVEVAAPPPAAAPPADDGSPRGAGRGRRVLAWTAVGVGAAALLLSAVTGAMALDRGGELDDKCPDAACSPALEDDVAAYDRLRITAFVSGAAGAAIVGTGIVLLSFGGSF